MRLVTAPARSGACRRDGPAPALPPSAESLKAEGRLVETPDLHGAFPRLEPAQIEMLETRGRRRRTRPGEVLSAEGEPDPAFYVVLSGMVAAWKVRRLVT